MTARRLISILLCASFLSAFTFGGRSGPLAATPEVRLVRVVPLDSSPDQLMDGEVGPDGQFCVADAGRGEVRCHDQRGRTLWHAGRKGEGPGEYRAIYRIGIGPTGTVIALDIGRMTVTQYDRSGRLVRTGLVPFTMRQVSDLAVLDDSVIVVAGYAPNAGASSRSGIHLFRWDTAVVHVRSFGRLPDVEKQELLNYWGSGQVRVSGAGTLVYQVAGPHEVQTFDQTGELLTSRLLSVEISGPADVFHVEESATRFAIRRSLGRSVIPLGVEPLSPTLWVMGRRVTPDTSQREEPKEVLNVLTSTGSELLTWHVPDSLSPMGLIEGPSSIRGFFGVTISEAGVSLLVFEFRP